MSMSYTNEAKPEVVDLTRIIAMNSLTLSGWHMSSKILDDMANQLKEMDEKIENIQNERALTPDEIYALFNDPVEKILSAAKELKSRMPRLS